MTGLQRYDIEVKTGNDMGAGTDEQIKLAINGTESSVSLELQAKDATTANKDIFEKGQVDSFVIYAKQVGNLKNIIIGHDAKGLSGDWKLEHVKIMTNNQTYKYAFLLIRTLFGT